MHWLFRIRFNLLFLFMHLTLIQEKSYDIISIYKEHFREFPELLKVK